MFGRSTVAAEPVTTEPEGPWMTAQAHHHAEILAELHLAKAAHDKAQRAAVRAEDLRVEAARAVDVTGERLGDARRLVRRVAEGSI